MGPQIALTVVRLAHAAHLELDEDLVLLGLGDGVVLAAGDRVLLSAAGTEGRSRPGASRNRLVR